MFCRAYKNFGAPKSKVNRQDSIVDVLLGDIYDRFNITHNKEASSTMDSEVFHSEFSASSSRLSGSDVDSKHARASLETLSKINQVQISSNRHLDSTNHPFPLSLTRSWRLERTG